MSDLFTADFFISNRRRLAELFTGKAPVVLTANGLVQRSTDTAYPFIQDSNFWYLTGIEEPNVVLVIDKGKEYLIVPDQSEVRKAFDGALDPDVISRISGVSEIIDTKLGWKRLEGRLKRVSSVAILSPSPSYIESIGMYTNPARRHLIRQLKSYNSNLEFLDLKQHLQRLRMVKQPEELQAIQRAVDVTTSALSKIENKFRKQSFKNEFDIELEGISF